MKINQLEAITATIILIAMFSMGLISAYPYQLNLSDGSLIDLNETNNSTNFTIYIVHVYQNATNITYINQTCYNCTYTNQTTSQIIQSNVTYVSYTSYNKSETDDKINSIDASVRGLLPSYSTKTELDASNARITALESKPASKNTDSHLWLWLLLISIGLLSIYNIYNSFWGNN